MKAEENAYAFILTTIFFNRWYIVSHIKSHITAFEKGKMQIRCLTDTHIIDIKPPLTIIYVGSALK